MLAILTLASTALSAQPSAAIVGDHAGTLSSLHVKLQVRLDSDGSLSATLDSQDQGACVPCRDLHFEGRALSFTVPTVRGSWKGTIAADGNSLSGDWQQPGNSARLILSSRSLSRQPNPLQSMESGWDRSSSAKRPPSSSRSQERQRRRGILFVGRRRRSLYRIRMREHRLHGRVFSFDIPLVGGHRRQDQAGPLRRRDGGQRRRRRVLGRLLHGNETAVCRRLVL